MGRRFKKDFQASLENCVEGGIIYHSGQRSKGSDALGAGVRWMGFGGGQGVIRKDKENASQNIQERGLWAVDMCRKSDGRPRCSQCATVWLLFLGAPEDEVS